MGYDRLLATALSPEVLGERTRVRDLLTVLVDDLIAEHRETTHPVALAILAAFGAEFVRLRRAVREGWGVEEFAADRDRGLPLAVEVDETEPHRE